MNAGKPQKQAVAIAYSKARDGILDEQERLYQENKAAGRALNAIPKGESKMGLTSAETKARPEWQAAKRRYEQSLTALQNFNSRNSAAIKAARKAGDCEVEMDAEVDMDESPTAAQIEAAIAAGEKELEHQRKALTSLRKGMDSVRRLAFDRRMETIDGHLVVTGCHITKANVCPYLGAEIPNSEALGLKADKIYLLYRDAAEIQSARDTYNRVPLLMQHVAVSADAPQQFLTVGTASNARFTHPYLDADLTIWTREGIDAIESGAQRELSCGYRYVADMTPGTSPEGEKYDGRMTQIIANHIALVEAGRAGPDVMVADAVLQSRIRLP